MANLSQNLGTMETDGLITDITPKTEVRGKTIRKLKEGEDVTYKRGTIFGVSDTDNKLVILGSKDDGTVTADCILTDDVTVGTTGDVVATVYTAGCFDPNKTTVADSYTIKDEDYDALRKYGIVFKAAFAAN